MGSKHGPVPRMTRITQFQNESFVRCLNLLRMKHLSNLPICTSYIEVLIYGNPRRFCGGQEVRTEFS